MKIAYCLNSICYVGGIEKSIVAKANALAAVAGNEVYLLVTDHKPGAGPSAGLSDAVHLVDLDINYYAGDWRSKWQVLKGFFVTRRLHKRRLAAALQSLRPDVVISVGQAEKYMLTEIKGDWVTVREQHFRKDFRRLAAASRGLFYRVAARVSDFYDYRCRIGRYDRVVILTHEDRERNWGRSERVSVIPNPLTETGRSVAPLNSRTVIAVGRLAWEKNYASLLAAFRRVADRHPDWRLEIYGDGPERTLLQSRIETLGLENCVRLCGSTPRVREKMLGASCFVLSSRFEGLPLAMLEAMSCGLPVVSYACPCGPRDVVEEGKEGFLVPEGDERMLAEKIGYLIEHPGERAEMGAAARAKSEHYSLDRIVPMWMELFGRLLAEKRNRC